MSFSYGFASGDFFQQQARGEGCDSAQEPLHPVKLYRLKIIEGLNAVDHAYGDTAMIRHAIPATKATSEAVDSPSARLMLWNSR